VGVFPGLGPPGCGKSTLLRRLELDPVPELDEETRRALLRHAPATGGDSPEAAADLVGNVWAWTGSVSVPYPYRADDGREDPVDAEERRVVRGGSWLNTRDRARCAFRSSYHSWPGGRFNFLGQAFRLPTERGRVRAAVVGMGIADEHGPAAADGILGRIFQMGPPAVTSVLLHPRRAKQGRSLALAFRRLRRWHSNQCDRLRIIFRDM